MVEAAFLCVTAGFLQLLAKVLSIGMSTNLGNNSMELSTLRDSPTDFSS